MMSHYYYSDLKQTNQLTNQLTLLSDLKQTNQLTNQLILFSDLKQTNQLTNQLILFSDLKQTNQLNNQLTLLSDLKQTAAEGSQLNGPMAAAVCTQHATQRWQGQGWHRQNVYIQWKVGGWIGGKWGVRGGGEGGGERYSESEEGKRELLVDTLSPTDWWYVTQLIQIAVSFCSVKADSFAVIRVVSPTNRCFPVHSEIVTWPQQHVGLQGILLIIMIRRRRRRRRLITGKKAQTADSRYTEAVDVCLLGLKQKQIHSITLVWLRAALEFFVVVLVVVFLFFSFLSHTSK